MAGCGAKTGLPTPDVLEETVTTVDTGPGVRDTGGSTGGDAGASTEVCVQIQPDAGGVQTVDLRTQPRLTTADVLFLIDHTGSTEPSIDNVKNNLQTTIVPGMAAAIPDVQFGVADFQDFPVFWAPDTTYGAIGDIPYTLIAGVTSNIAVIQGAVNGIQSFGGGDEPEAQVEALYQSATGEGYAPWISPRGPCSVPGSFGYPCFRPNAQPIIVLITDSTFHNPPSGLDYATYSNYDPYDFIHPSQCPPSLPRCAAVRAPHTYTETVTALNAIHARVIGVCTGQPPIWSHDYLIRVCQDTGSITSTGSPLEFDVGQDASELDTRVVTAAQILVHQVRFDASAQVLDVDPQHPAHTVVLGIHPASASPMSGVQGMDANRFLGVVPGTELTFALDLSGRVTPTVLPQRFPARVQFYSDNRASLGHQDIVIVVPGTDGQGCGTNGTGTGLDAGM